MTRNELQVLSQAHAVALTAMVAPETRAVPMAAAFALRQAAREDMPQLRRAAEQFTEALRDSHGRLEEVALAGRHLRATVSQLMAFVPVDAGRVDIHG
jgi:hypothetical protein